MILIRFLLGPLLLLLAEGCLGVEANSSETQVSEPGVWWNWEVNREWSSNHRRAIGKIQMFADAEKTEPLQVESLRFFLELDCPIAVGPELVINEMRNTTELGAEVRCTVGSPGKFEVRWRFEAVDARFGSVDGQGTVPK